MKKIFIFFLTLCPCIGYTQPPVGAEFIDSNPFNIIDREISVDYSSLNNLFDAFRNNQNIEANQIFSLWLIGKNIDNNQERKGRIAII